ncbi:Oxysterol-binding protein-domain-containing protein [Mycena pura]|uniref:Oxysterol-binding protein-domain-containing protein n=1 Tax=Mycena pura TaxID=153505 RepID=A0AAD6V855_9AGAR|nr:Oxysterol-binding protein-domain-containing protein [Mycena pura]
MASSTSSSSLRKSTTSAFSLHAPDTTAAEPLYQVKLLNALRSGDPALIHPFLTEIGKEKRKSADQRAASGVASTAEDASKIDTGAAALHLAIRCGSLETITLLLSHRTISPNGVHPLGSGTTALHLASSLGRADVVDRLLEQEDVDDTRLDNDGRTARDVARGKDVVRVLDESRAFLNASYRSLLRSYILSPFPPASSGSSPHSQGGPPPALLALLSSPRAAHLDLSYIDDASGRTLLHEAARRRDLRLLELAVRAGADVFVRDRRGKLPGEEKTGEGKVVKGGKGDGEVKAFLRQLTNQDAALMRSQSQSVPVHAPSLRGYLNKYTNVAKGWNTRWFVLEGGVLSYYRNRADEAFASRGSIAVRNCILKPPSDGDHLRFEIHSGAGGKGGEKWYMKANHPIEAGRWVSAIAASVAWAKAREGDDTDGGDGRPSIASGVAGSGASIVSTSTSGRARLVSVLRKGKNDSRHNVPSRGEADSILSDHGRTSGEGSPKPGESDPDARDMDADAEEEEDDDEEDNVNSSASASMNGKHVTAPHETTFELLGNSATTQLELTLGLVDSGSAHDALYDALATVTEFVTIARERDVWWRRKLARAQSKQTAWERSLASAVREGEVLERELRRRSRQRGSRFFDAAEAQAALAGGSAGTLRARSKRLSVLPPTTVEETGPVVDSPLPQEETARPPPIVLPPPAVVAPQPVRSSTAETVSPTTATAATFGAPSYMNYYDAESLIDTDEEDEFFDAIESNTIPNLLVHESLTSPTHSDLALADKISVEPYAGYMHLRERLLLTNERPSTSLWSVLKHSIGKDLTKISFPVFFNEPTSMLERMAEDMEFSECLDVASKERDPHRRIAFIAAFAMSNYSSTIGRIAKPFNPMLGETFEYVRIDKEYRYLSEQVSHHPPISACMAESPFWKYYGEVDAQNKFMGKSFEIRPTGIAHAELHLPAEFAPSYPKAPSPFEGKVSEHFSWKKVTTNVSGFILGAPTIDHYGDMLITNHRTKDTCILTFKPRGWRGKDAYEISGRVMDAHGRVTYEIAGRWNSQLIARQVGVGSGALNPDLSVSGATSPSATPEYILLWRNSEKPQGSPFNLTPFAITLNDCPKDTLKPYLCPTDCRLRPDQRAFELGKYEIANSLKNQQEEYQRATRKRRELGELPPHRPRWFTAETDGDTGERVWTPSRFPDGAMEYWAERERLWRLGGNLPWKNVDPIFIEEPDFIR